MDLRQAIFTYNACDPFTKNEQRIKNFKETGYSRYIYENELDKICFQYDMTYGDLKELNRKTAADKILHDKAFDIANDPKYDEYQRGLASIL